MTLYQKVVAWCESGKEPDSVPLQQPSGALEPVSVDRVAEWLAKQDRALAPPPKLSVVPPPQVEDFLVEGDIEFPISTAVHFGASDPVEDLYEAFKRIEQQLDAISDSLQIYTPRF